MTYKPYRLVLYIVRKISQNSFLYSAASLSYLSLLNKDQLLSYYGIPSKLLQINQDELKKMQMFIIEDLLKFSNISSLSKDVDTLTGFDSETKIASKVREDFIIIIVHEILKSYLNCSKVVNYS